MNILNRKNLFTTKTISGLIMVLIIVVIVNIISLNFFGRLDLTAEKQYSLSQASKKTVESLYDTLTIKAYFSEQLPPNLIIVKQYLNDILGEYQSYSGKVNIEFIDPAQNEDVRKEVLALGIPELEMQILDKDEFKIQKGFLGLAVFYKDKKEAIPVIQSTGNLEYDLTSIIKRVTAESEKTVGFLTGHGEHGIYESFASAAEQEINDYTSIKKSLDKNYLVKTIDISKGQPILDIDTLIVGGPKEALNERELYELDQYILRGGKVIFLVDEVNITSGLQAELNQTELETLLANYGVQINQDLIADPKSKETARFSSGYSVFILPYSLWPKLINENFDQESPIMAKLQSVSLPWVSSITPNDNENIKHKILASTTSSALTIKEPFNLDPQAQYAPGKEKVPVIIETKGKFSSLFADQDIPLPELDEAKDDPVDNVPETPEKLNESSNESQIITIADSDFINDFNLEMFPQNINFFLNAVDYLTIGEDLISIRAKTIQERPIDEDLDNNAKTWIRIINIGLIPLIIIIIGVVRFYLRKKR